MADIARKQSQTSIVDEKDTSSAEVVGVPVIDGEKGKSGAPPPAYAAAANDELHIGDVRSLPCLHLVFLLTRCRFPRMSAPLTSTRRVTSALSVRQFLSLSPS
jgi:hypothetical protein